MRVNIDYVQKNAHIHTHSSYLHLFSFLELPHVRPLIYFYTLPLRNIANKEKERTLLLYTTLDLGYVVVEITKKKEGERKDNEFTIIYDYHQQIGIATTQRVERTLPFDRMEECNSIFSSLIAFRHILWKARHARQRQKEREEKKKRRKSGRDRKKCVSRSES